MNSFAEITALAALSIVAVESILKLNVVPITFANRFPVTTNVLLSIAASIIVTWKTMIILTGLSQWVAYIATLSVLSAITYNMTLRNSYKIQSLSNKDSNRIE